MDLLAYMSSASELDHLFRFTEIDLLPCPVKTLQQLLFSKTDQPTQFTDSGCHPWPTNPHLPLILTVSGCPTHPVCGCMASLACSTSLLPPSLASRSPKDLGSWPNYPFVWDTRLLMGAGRILSQFIMLLTVAQHQMSCIRPALVGRLSLGYLHLHPQRPSVRQLIQDGINLTSSASLKCS